MIYNIVNKFFDVLGRLMFSSQKISDERNYYFEKELKSRLLWSWKSVAEY